MKQATARKLRQFSYVVQLTADVRYISCENNVVADCFCRPPDLNALCNEVQAVDFIAISRAQQTDDSVITLMKGFRIFMLTSLAPYRFPTVTLTFCPSSAVSPDT